jgi:hypothetical protein
MVEYTIKSISQMPNGIDVMVEINDGYTIFNETFTLTDISQFSIEHIDNLVRNALAAADMFNDCMLALGAEIDTPRSV